MAVDFDKLVSEFPDEEKQEMKEWAIKEAELLEYKLKIGLSVYFSNLGRSVGKKEYEDLSKIEKQTLDEKEKELDELTNTPVLERMVARGYSERDALAIYSRVGERIRLYFSDQVERSRKQKQAPQQAVTSKGPKLEM